MKSYEQETRLMAAFKKKKHAKEWMQEQRDNDFAVDSEPRKVGDGWLCSAHKLELIELD